jgi:hypothetical protein
MRFSYDIFKTRKRVTDTSRYDRRKERERGREREKKRDRESERGGGGGGSGTGIVTRVRYECSFYPYSINNKPLSQRPIIFLTYFLSLAILSINLYALQWEAFYFQFSKLPLQPQSEQNEVRRARKE